MRISSLGRIISMLLLLTPLEQASGEDLRTPKQRFLERSTGHIKNYSTPRQRSRNCSMWLRSWLNVVFSQKLDVAEAPARLQECYGPHLYISHLPLQTIVRFIPVIPKEIKKSAHNRYRDPVEMRMLCCKIVYIRIRRFSLRAGRHLYMMMLLNRVVLQGVSRFIIDVRGNPGGHTKVSNFVAALFAPHARQVAYYLVRGNSKTPVVLNRFGYLTRQPYIVVIADKRSASASEMLIAILRRWHRKRFVFIGQKTYGKGTIQIVLRTGHFRIAVTSARWAVGGRIYDKRGIVPDVSIKMNKNVAIKKAIMLLKR